MRTLFALAALTSICLAQEPVTEAEALEFAGRLEDSINEGNPDVFDEAVDISGMLDEAMKTFKAEEGFEKAFREGAESAQGMGTTLVSYMSQYGGGLKFLRFRVVDGSPRALFRKNQGEAVDYLDLTLAKKGNRIVVRDIYTYSMGEAMTTVFRRGYMMAVAAEQQAGKGQNAGLDDMKKLLPVVKKVNERRLAGDPKGAWEALQEMPASLRKEKWVLLQRVMVASELDEKIYEAELDAFAKEYPSEPALDLMGIDRHYLKKDYEKALACVDSVTKTLGGDPHMRFMRGSVLMAMKKYDEAKKEARTAIQEEPELASPRWLLVTISLEEKAFAETGPLLDETAKALGLEIVDLEGIPEYEEYVKSPEYKKWLESRK